MNWLFLAAQYLVPHQLFTRFVGLFAACRWRPLKSLLIRGFIRSYDVDMSQAADPDPAAYACFNDFFVRALKAGARPLDDSAGEHGILSPADGRISAIGAIEDERLFQAKGHDFSLRALLGGDAILTDAFRGGRFATVYLSPRDYHRVHMPFPGRLRRTIYLPGRLFSVNQVTAEHVHGLFARNERLVCLFDTSIGPLAVILVGAMVVGSIETVWDGLVPRGGEPRVREYAGEDSPLLDKGAELGRFKLGSTVILLFGPGVVEWSARLGDGSAINMGQLLGQISARA